MSHQSALASALFGISDGPGGEVLIACGESGWPRKAVPAGEAARGREPGGPAIAPAPYWAGLRHAPVDTLFEAVLRYITAGPYARIVACTGMSSQGHLPRWRVGSLTLGDEALIWDVKGGVPPAAPPQQQAAKSAGPRTVKTHVAPPPAPRRWLWRSTGHTYFDRLERYLSVRNELLKATERVAVLVDFRFLIPNDLEARNILRQPPSDDLLRINAIQADLPRSVAESRVDVIVFAEHPAAPLLAEWGSDCTGSVLEGYFPGDWESLKSRFAGALPDLHLGVGARSASVERRPSALPKPLTASTDDGRLEPLRGLQRASLSVKSAPAPPREAGEIDLEFWADLDLGPLREEFEDQIIGQSHVKVGILAALERLQADCRSAREHGTRTTGGNRSLRLPVFGLFGAQGMGKTTFCKVMARALFGTEEFSEIITLTQRTLGETVLGIAPPWVGWDREPPFISFVRRTNGLGLVCFDEFTRVMTERHGDRAEALAPLYQVLEDRSFEPTSPAFRPPGRRYHFANTLFVLAGNVGHGAGFTRIEDLGPPLVDRITHRFSFESLQEADYFSAAARAIARAAKEWSANYGGALPAAPEVADALVAAVVTRFRASLDRDQKEPSLRQLDRMVRELTFERALRDKPAAVLGVDLLPAEWSREA